LLRVDEHITVSIPGDLLERARRTAADEGRSVDSLVAEGLELEMRRVAVKRARKSGERRLPPVSKAMGGLRPGIDLTRFSDIQGMDDLEYAERLKDGFK
jgi:hypothetical protein